MIKITHVSLRNFCQFDKFDLDISEGLTRIKAPNGFGKTNLFRGIVYGFTSWCDPSVGTQTSLQKDDSSVPGYVELEILVDDQLYTLRRYTVTSAKQADILLQGEEVIAEKRQRVNNWMEEHLPVSLTIIAQLMWLRQENSSWLLTNTAASINTFLGLIFDTKSLEKLRDHIKTAYDKIATLRSDFEITAKECTSKLNELPDIEGLESQLKTDEATLGKLQAEYNALNGITKEEFDTSKTKLINSIALLKNKLQETDSYFISTDIESLELDLIDKQNNLTKYNKQLRDADLDYQAAVILLKNLKAKLDMLSIPEKLKICQYCGNTIGDLTSYKNKKASQVMGSEIAYEDALKQLSRSIEDTELIVRSSNETVNRMRHNIVELDTEIPKLTEAVANYKKSEEVKRTIKFNITTLESQLDTLEKTPIISKSKKALEVEIVSLTNTVDTVRQALIDFKAIKSVCEKELKQAEIDKKCYNRNNYVKSILQRLRDALSQSRAQARFISSKIDLINAHISSYMELSEMPFTLRLHPVDHIFVYKMNDSDVEHPAAMLSGAQKAAASISIQMALVAVAAPELSMLLVDEADAALSPENKIIAARLYRTLTDSVAGTVFVISHAEAVSEDCDRVVEL